VKNNKGRKKGGRNKALSMMCKLATPGSL